MKPEIEKLTNTTHTPIPLKEYDEAMWDAFCGSERAEDGREPLYYENDEAVILVDNTGIQIMTGENFSIIYSKDMDGYDISKHFVWEFMRIEDLTNEDRLIKLFGFYKTEA